MHSSVSGLLLAGRCFITASIQLLARNVFVCLLSWFNVGMLYASKNLSVCFTFSSLVDWKFLRYVLRIFFRISSVFVIMHSLGFPFYCLDIFIFVFMNVLPRCVFLYHICAKLSEARGVPPWCSSSPWNWSYR